MVRVVSIRQRYYWFHHPFIQCYSNVPILNPPVIKDSTVLVNKRRAGCWTVYLIVHLFNQIKTDIKTKKR